jgi:hypothetical protein
VSPSRLLQRKWQGEGWATKHGFDLAKRVLNSRVDELLIDPMELSRERLGTWDVVFYCGILYHMRWVVTYRVIGVIPNLGHIGYYLSCSLILFPIVRSISIRMPKLSLAIKIFVGIAVYARLLGLARKVVKGHPQLAAGCMKLWRICVPRFTPAVRSSAAAQRWGKCEPVAGVSR